MKIINTSAGILRFISSICLIILLYPAGNLIGQKTSYGDMRIFNFDQNTYKGGPQTWDIEVTDDGNVYFCNNKGLLQFDGINFNTYPLPNLTIVRSVKTEGDSLIYVGGQNEFGYFKPVNAALQYTSLSKHLPASAHDFTDVWNIHQLGTSTIFQSSNYLFFYEDNSLTPVRGPDFTISASNIIDNQAVLADEGGGLYVVQNKRIKELTDPTDRKPIITRHVAGTMDSLILFTQKHGIFYFINGQFTKWKQNLDFLSNAVIYSVSESSRGFIVSTSRDGIYYISYDGNILQHFSKQHGLQNDNVLTTGVDKFDNIWVGLNRGIDFIANSAPYRFIVPDGALRGTGYTMIKFDNKIYLGTNNGLYVHEDSKSESFDSKTFSLVENTVGQAWSLNVIDDKLYLSHHDGLFLIEGDVAKKVGSSSGSWLLRKVEGQPIVIEGTYYGINKYTVENGKLIFQKKIAPEFQESSRLVAIDGHHIWIAHPYRGLFLLEMNDDWSAVKRTRRFDKSDGFQSNLNIHVFKVYNEVLFTDKGGIYRYNESLDSFTIHQGYSQYFDSTNFVRYLANTNDGNIWFATEKEIGYLDIDENSLSKSIKKRVIPSLPVPITGGFENIYTIDERAIFASEVGFISLPFAKLSAYMNYQPSPKVISFKAMGREDTTLIGSGFSVNGREFKLSHSYSGVLFQVSCSNYALTPTMQYQYKLEGQSDEWQPWTNEHSKMFNHLSEGNFTFYVRSKLMNKVSEPVKISFYIAPPWYRTTAAIITFSLGFMGLLGLVFLLPSLRFRKEKKALKQEQAMQIKEQKAAFQSKFQETEKKIDKLENEKLEVEIKSKNQQLASTTMHLVQKGEFLLKMKEELDTIKKKAQHSEVKSQINKLIRTIENDSQVDDNWDSFEMAFDQVHVNFTRRIKEQYPQLTPNDIKLCTYLKLNLSSKEIASLTNISVRGVEISRYRLRKKLELDSSDNLVEFMQSI